MTFIDKQTKFFRLSMSKEKKELQTSLTSLKGRIEKAKKSARTPSIKKAPPPLSTNKFLNIGTEFVAGILAGVGGGLFIDWVWGTSPWGLITLFILGSAAGFLNVYRTLTNSTKKS